MKTLIFSRSLPFTLLIVAACGGNGTLNSPAGPTSIGGARVSLTSAAFADTTSSCSVDVQGAPESVAGGGGRFTLVLTAEQNCAWIVTGESGLSFSPATGHGTGQVSVAVEGNPDLDRTLSLTVNDHTLHFRQPQGCSYDFTPGSLTVDASGGPRTVSVSTLPGCLWFAKASEDWIDVKEDRGEGPADLPFVFDQNFGGQRHAFLTIGNRIVHVTQSAAD